MGIEIRLAKTREELDAIYRLRYEVYVEEMHRTQRYADHGRKMIIDPLDINSFVFGAWDGSNLVATVRQNFYRLTNIGEYFDMYHLHLFTNALLDHTTLTTRLMVMPKYRKTTLPIRMCSAAYEFCTKRGSIVDLIDCNHPLDAFFKSCGYVVHRDDLVHPEYGQVFVMKLFAADSEMLERVRSPFRKLLRDWDKVQLNAADDLLPQELQPCLPI